MIPTNEFELMATNGVIEAIDQRGRYNSDDIGAIIVAINDGEDLVVNDSNDVWSLSKWKNSMKSWNRPTTSWSLTCELEGKTRKDAVAKSQIQLKMSNHYEHVWNVGVAIVVLYLTVFIASIVFASFAGPGGMLAFPAFTRFFWIIMGPILLTSLAEMRHSIESNLANVQDFQNINECSDKEVRVDE